MWPLICDQVHAVRRDASSTGRQPPPGQGRTGVERPQGEDIDDGYAEGTHPTATVESICSNSSLPLTTGIVVDVKWQDSWWTGQIIEIRESLLNDFELEVEYSVEYEAGGPCYWIARGQAYRMTQTQPQVHIPRHHPNYVI